MTHVELLTRWIALDAELGSYGLDKDEFARRFAVSEKTIQRDLAAFRELGQRITIKLDFLGEPRRLKDGAMNEGSPRYRSIYDGVRPLFVVNLHRR